jgi:sugar lactone lactonase YvrE
MDGSPQPVLRLAFRWFLRRIIAVATIGAALSLLGCETGSRARPDAGRWVSVVPDAGVDRRGAPDRPDIADGALADAARADAAGGDGAPSDGARSDGRSPGCDGAACRPVVLAAGENQPCGLALDAENIYWTVASGDVRKMPLAGGEITTLASGQNRPCSIVVDGPNVYWVNAASAGAIMTVTAAGGTPVKLADITGQPWKLAIRAGVIYWTSQTAGSVSKMPEAGGIPTILAINQGTPVAIDVDATTLVWSSVGQSAIRSLALAPLGAVTTLAEDQEAASSLRVQAGVAYWTNDETGEVRRAALAGGAPVTLATSSGSYGLALDDRDVYFTDDGAGTIWRVPQAGGDATLLAEGQQLPGEIAVDGLNVYWVNTVVDGAVMKLAK